MIPFVTWEKQMCSPGKKKDQNVIFLELQGHILNSLIRGMYVCVCVCVCVCVRSEVEGGGRGISVLFFVFLFFSFPVAFEK